MEIVDVVTKLIGKIDPVGETHTDNARYDNIKVMTALIDSLMYEIHEIARYERHEYSINRAKRYCEGFLKHVQEEIKATLEPLD